MPDKRQKILPSINSPKDILPLPAERLKDLCDELRDEIVETVSKNGGHLAPNLGVIELTVALHKVFNSPEDRIIWDVGHQSYAHKLLTGRREAFKTIRKYGGLSGFTLRSESDYDCFGAGHAGTAISAATGFAAAAERKGSGGKVVAVVGDGSLICGISLEALNNLRSTCKDLILVVNDNKMSISKSVGAIPNYLNRIITGKSYNHFKAFAKMAVKRMPGGEDIIGGIQKLEEATKSLFVPGVLFEELGLRYVGPINGHELPELLSTFESVKEFNRPVLVHVITEKGHGCEYAKEAPEKFHGVSTCFNPDTGDPEDSKPKGGSYSSAFGKAAMELAGGHDDVVAITAAMSSGTGLSEFAKSFPDRFFDVGIAEEHAMVFAAGLAASGFRPIVAMYASFLQRALDCLYHDVCLQKLPVIVCADRAGIVEDGPTHHGIYDLSFLLGVPNLAILCPKDEAELREMLFAAYAKSCPAVIRYPRGGSGGKGGGGVRPIEWGEPEIVREGPGIAIWAVGRELFTALDVADILRKDSGLEATVVNARFLKPFAHDMLLSMAERMPVATIEDCIVSGGIGGLVDGALINSRHRGVMHFGWDGSPIPHGELELVRESAGMTPAAIAASVKRWMASRDK